MVIDGKTGARRLPLVESVPHLNNWLNKHPNPDKDAPLWCKIQLGRSTKHLHPHDVDHARQVHGVGPSRVEQLNNAGIETGTDLVEHSAKELADIESVNVSTAQKWLRQFDYEQKPDVIERPRCEELNEHDATFCMRCEQALDIDAAEEVETAEEATTENADDEDLQIALQIVKAMRSDRDEVESLVASLNE